MKKELVQIPPARGYRTLQKCFGMGSYRRRMRTQAMQCQDTIKIGTDCKLARVFGKSPLLQLDNRTDIYSHIDRDWVCTF